MEDEIEIESWLNKSVTDFIKLKSSFTEKKFSYNKSPSEYYLIQQKESYTNDQKEVKVWLLERMDVLKFSYFKSVSAAPFRIIFDEDSARLYLKMYWNDIRKLSLKNKSLILRVIRRIVPLGVLMEKLNKEDFLNYLVQKESQSVKVLSMEELDGLLEHLRSNKYGEEVDSVLRDFLINNKILSKKHETKIKVLNFLNKKGINDVWFKDFFEKNKKREVSEDFSCPINSRIYESNISHFFEKNHDLLVSSEKIYTQLDNIINRIKQREFTDKNKVEALKIFMEGKRIFFCVVFKEEIEYNFKEYVHYLFRKSLLEKNSSFELLLKFQEQFFLEEKLNKVRVNIDKVIKFNKGKL